MVIPNKQEKVESLNQDIEPKVKQEVKEVLVEVKKDTSTKPTSHDERAKIESEVEMVKICKDSAGKWIWKRSDRITAEDKKKRASMIERIKKGLKI